MLLLLCGDIETNPGPQRNCCLKFFHWNLNSICARGSIKIPLIESYNSIHHFDRFAVSESMQGSEMNNENISIERFSKDVFKSDHPSNSRIGGVCVYFCEDLPIKRRQDLELLQEMVVAEINFSRKKVFFVAMYRSPSQSSEEFQRFIDRLQLVLNCINKERPHSVIVTGDLN